MRAKFILIIFLLIGANFKSLAQCSNNFTKADDSFTFAGLAGETHVKQYKAGQYMPAYCQAGVTYTISTCGFMDFDTQLTIYGEDGTFIAFNDDQCGVQSRITFTSSKCQFIRILLSERDCNSSGLTTTVMMLQTAAASGLPSLPTGTANKTIFNHTSALLTATCANNDAITWYTATGTSPIATGSPFVTQALTANTSYRVEYAVKIHRHAKAIL